MTIAMPLRCSIIRKHVHHSIQQQNQKQLNQQQQKHQHQQEKQNQFKQQQQKTSDAFHIEEKYPETKILMLMQSRTKNIKVNIQLLSKRKIIIQQQEKILQLRKTKLYKGNRTLVRARNIFTKGKTYIDNKCIRKLLYFIGKEKL